MNYVETFSSPWLACHCGQQTCFPAAITTIIPVAATTTTTAAAAVVIATATATAAAAVAGDGDDGHDDTNNIDDSDFLLQHRHLSVYMLNKEKEKLLYLKI